MGSDLYLNPPRKIYASETFGPLEEPIFRERVAALLDESKEFEVIPYEDGSRLVRVWTGAWS